jgi:hypothetical protein
VALILVVGVFVGGAVALAFLMPAAMAAVAQVLIAAFNAILLARTERDRKTTGRAD